MPGAKRVETGHRPLRLHRPFAFVRLKQSARRSAHRQRERDIHADHFGDVLLRESHSVPKDRRPAAQTTHDVRAERQLGLQRALLCAHLEVEQQQRQRGSSARLDGRRDGAAAHGRRVGDARRDAGHP